MPLDGITLGAIAAELNQTLIPGRVDKVQQPEADELLLTIRAGGANHRLLLSASASYARVHLTEQPRKNPDTPPMFCMLLRKHLGGARVVQIAQIGSDRVLHIGFEALDELGDVAARTLVIEIMGKHSNIMLVEGAVGAVEGGRILACARNVTQDISRVREVLPGLPYENPPAQDKHDPATADAETLCARIASQNSPLLRKALQNNLYGVSPQAAGEIAFRIAGSEDAPASQTDIRDAAVRALHFLQTMPGRVRPTLYLGPDGTPADVTSFLYLSRDPALQQAMDTMSGALDAFYVKKDTAERVKQRAASMRRVMLGALERCEKKLAIQLETQQETARMDELRKQADLLMAAQHEIPRGADRARVPDYFDPEMKPVEIVLDPSLSAIDNAQKLYKQYAKRRAAARLIEGQLAENRAEIDYIAGQISNIDNCTDIREVDEIRAELIREGYLRATSADRNKKKAAQSTASEPFHFVSDDGIEIYIGKNNTQNDRLTQYADGNDTWMHAKDIPGSHVIVRHENPPNRTLTQAARLTAYYSRARDSGLVPVDITLRKYVKKPNGSRPGFAIYTHQRTVYVPPSSKLEG